MFTHSICNTVSTNAEMQDNNKKLLMQLSSSVLACHQRTKFGLQDPDGTFHLLEDKQMQGV